jgi:L-lactate dehydrogenase complex protein LldG
MDREPFLAEIAASLGRPRKLEAPLREARGPSPFASDVAQVALAERFARELTLVAGEVVLAQSVDEARAALAAELAAERRAVTWGWPELVAACGLDFSDLWRGLGGRCREPYAADFREAALAADVGVTGVDFAIADTGTLVISAAVGRPRSVSLLPRLHIALVRPSQLVSRMGYTFSRLRQARPSAVHFVTGPSRTSDIENDLSIGVHGPARVLAIVLPEERA